MKIEHDSAIGHRSSVIGTTITFQEKKLFYRVSGSGRNVILVHGFGETGSVWDQQVAFLQSSWRVIVPDLPGSGLSEEVPDMSMEGLAEAIHSIIHEENIHACPVIGHSMGGYVALALAEHYPNHVSALGLFHSTAFADNEEKKATRRKGIGFIREHGSTEFLRTTSPNLFSGKTREKNPGLVTEFVGGLSNFSPTALVSYYDAMMQRPDRTEVLKNSDLPVLFVMGEHDTAVPLQDSLKLCYLPEKAYIHILHESGHMGMLEELEKSNGILDNFLSDT
ncbi:MAG: alpha/beta hydrolase [Chitinophagaceae bacterium]|nr:MAG: alpha/beta hydrolase [Chitinophagaceae bacterium]